MNQRVHRRGRAAGRLRAASSAVVLLWVGACGAGPGGEAEVGGRAPLPDGVREELTRMGAEDQAARQGMTVESVQDTAFARALVRGDSARSLRLREIVSRHGWPVAATAGAEAARAAFLVLQHSPLDDFQQAMLPTLDSLARDGAMPRNYVAMLVDRMLVGRGLPQRYGTQFKMEDGRLLLHPVEDEPGLEERRREMGLPPVADYVRLLEDMYGGA
jgi:hypothetical protein